MLVPTVTMRLCGPARVLFMCCVSAHVLLVGVAASSVLAQLSMRHTLVAVAPAVGLWLPCGVVAADLYLLSRRRSFR